MASFVTPLVSSVPGTSVEAIVVVWSMSQITVATAGEVAMMSSMRSSKVTCPMVVMPGMAMPDPVARPVQRVGEDGIAVERRHERQNIEVVADLLSSMAIAGFSVGGEE